MISDELAEQLARDVIRTLNRYANFRAYWRHTKRKETIVSNIKKAVLDRINQDKSPLQW